MEANLNIEKTAQTDLVTVDRAALREVLQALVGPGHLIRELQATRGLHSMEGDYVNPIEILLEQYQEPYHPPAAAPKSAGREALLIEYTPGQWFDATSVDLMEAFYLSRLPAIREAAKEHGYAIGVHGSLRRDLDLIASPWHDGASDADTLAAAIHHAACGFTSSKYQWELKPAGRVAVSMPICWTHRHGVLSDGHIDLSVCAAVSTPQVRQAGNSGTGEPLATVPDEVRKAAQSLKKNGYSGPLMWARKVIDWVAEQDAAREDQGGL